MSTGTTARIVQRPSSSRPRLVTADICVVGAGIAGVSAALEAARLGRRVVIVDAAQSLGGQAIAGIKRGIGRAPANKSLRTGDFLRLAFWPSGHGARPSVPRLGDPPARPPAWMTLR